MRISLRLCLSFYIPYRLIKMDFIDMVEPVEKTNEGPARSRKAILWGGDDLLSQAVGLFLESSMTWDVIRVSSEEGVEKLIQETKRVNPEAVILCQDRVGDSDLALRLINEQLCIKVLVVSLENNLMQVYSKHNVVIQGTSDLLSIFDSGNFSNCTLGKEV